MSGSSKVLNIFRGISARRVRSGATQRVKNLGLQRQCTSCGTQFHLTSIELSFYQAEGLTSPRVCRMCQRNVGADAFQSSRYANDS